MGLIDDKKKKKFYEDQRLSAKGMSLAMDSVKFAETELQNLAIEFADWKDKLYTCTEINDDKRHKYSTRELFIKFIEQRKTN